VKPFHFGVNVGHAGSRAEWQAKARKVEGLGYVVREERLSGGF